MSDQAAEGKEKGVDNTRSPFYKDIAIIRFNPDEEKTNFSELGPSV
jgi:hypothetical protein